MEAAGLAIGVFAVIKPTAEAIATLWSDTKNFGGDAEHLRLRFSGIGKAGDAKLSRVTSWTKKARWVMSDKKSAEDLVAEFEVWTKRVKSLLELAWWPLPFFSTVSQMEKLEEDKDAGQAGMLEGIGMRKLLAPESSQIPVETAKALKISRLEFKETMRFQELEVGQIPGKGGVIVEYKSYEQDRTGA
ncbi:hypothetical protein VE02_09334 [Pseudogymnoascus sp. 03VT05]|nr:hypothetical protein VE02_09334 [Pseudogymnoascus sp. 03VT05]